MMEISPEIEEKLRSLTITRKYRKGDRITAPSDIKFYGFYIRKGAARVSMIRDEHDTTCSFAIDDEFLALTSFPLPTKTAMVSIEFLEPTEVIMVPLEQSHRTFFEEVSIAYESMSFILASLLNHTRNLEERLIVLQCADARQRYKWFCNRYPQIVDRVSSIHVASFLGITKETLYRIRGGKY